MKKKKVLILGKLPPPYMGPAIATKIILESSLRDRYDLLHLNTRANEDLNTMGKWSISKVFLNLSMYFRLVRMLVKHKPSLVLIPISQSTTGYLKDFFFIAISRFFGRRILLHLRGSNFQNWLGSLPSIIRNLVKSSLRLANGVIVLGNNLKALFQGIFPDNRIFVVPNGGNYVLNYSVKSHKSLQLLYLGNLQDSKGIEDVIMAMVELSKSSSANCQLNVVGAWRSEKTREACMKIIKEHALPVSFHPPASGVQKLSHLRNADIFLFTPRAPEGHPWVIVEAMAAGLPIISTDRGAIIESVHHEVNGYIVNASSPVEISQKLNLLVSDSELRERMGKESRRLYEENFTEERMVDKLTETFESVMNPKN